MEFTGMNIDPDMLYRFRFKASGMSDNLAHFVLTEDPNKMMLFLKQHNFDLDMVNLDRVPLKDHEGDSEFMLEYFIMRSNYSDQVFKIMSTEHMIYDCGRYVADIMSSALVFGPEIIREDVPIMRVISELVNELDHVYIMDHTLTDPETHEPFSSNYERYTKIGYPTMSSMCELDKYYHEDCSYDDSGLYDSLLGSITKGYLLPFTVEAYVSYFASLLTDSYN